MMTAGSSYSSSSQVSQVNMELLQAVYDVNEQRVHQLVTSPHSKQLIHSTDRDGWSVVHYAVWTIAHSAGLTHATTHPVRDVIKMAASRRILHDILLPVGSDVTATNVSGVSILHLGAWYGLCDVIELGVRAGCDVNVRADDSYKAHGLQRRLPGKTLFKRDGDLYRPDTFCMGCDVTPLYLAARVGHDDVIRLLLSAGANVNSAKSVGSLSGITPLHAAAARGHVVSVECLLERSECQVNMAASDGGTALHCAVEFNQPEVVRSLLRRADIDVMAGKRCIEASNVTALHLAATVGSDDITRDLVRAGANVNSQASDGFTALHMAAQLGACAVAGVLLDAGADTTLTAEFDSCSGLTPLHVAIRAGREKMVDRLLAANADVHAVCNIASISQVGVLHLAAVYQRGIIARTLIQNGADITALTSTGSSALFLAVTEGCADVVDVLIEAGCKAEHSVSEVGLLHVAVSHNSPLIVRSLVSAGFDINEIAVSPDDVIVTPLYLATDRGLVEMVEVLLSLGAEVNQSIRNGVTPLHSAAENGGVAIAQLLINASADINLTATFTDLCDVTPLHLAVLCEHTDVVELLVKSGAALNQQARSRTCSPQLFTPLYLAVKNHDPRTVRTLLAANCDVNKSRDDGWTPLHSACEAGAIEIVRLLLEAKCDICRTATFDDNRDVLALHQAAQEGHEEIISLLVAAGNDVNTGKSWRGETGITALHLAAEAGHASTVDRLISLGANVNATKNNGWTPLHWAAQENFPTIAKALIHAGAKVNLQATFDSHINCTPLHQAAQHGHSNVVELLIDAGADLTATKCQGTTAGVTALHLASALGHRATVRLLVTQRSDLISVANSDGFTALHFAALNGHIDVVRMLLTRNQAKNSVGSTNKPPVKRAMLTEVLPIHLAAMSGHAAIIKFLVTAGMPVDATTDHFTRPTTTALQLAAKGGHIKAVTTLLELGADVNLADSIGLTPLHLASENEAGSAVITSLLQAGADMERVSSIPGGQGIRPLHMAAICKMTPAIRQLIAGGCDVNSACTLDGVEGLTALHIAATAGHKDTVRQLLKHAECDVTLQSSNGNTASELALSNGFTEIYRLLRRHQRRANIENDKIDRESHWKGS